jgi:hypothetical protein
MSFVEHRAGADALPGTALWCATPDGRPLGAWVVNVPCARKAGKINPLSLWLRSDVPVWLRWDRGQAGRAGHLQSGGVPVNRIGIRLRNIRRFWRPLRGAWRMTAPGGPVRLGNDAIPVQSGRGLPHSRNWRTLRAPCEEVAGTRGPCERLRNTARFWSAASGAARLLGQAMIAFTTSPATSVSR